MDKIARPVIGTPVDAKTCDICKKRKALTAEGQLFSMLISSPKFIYRRMLCSDCTKLFNQSWWNTTKKYLFIIQRCWHDYVGRLNKADKLKMIEALVTDPKKVNSLTAQQVIAILHGGELEVSFLPKYLRVQDRP